jgi:hypothetical protein
MGTWKSIVVAMFVVVLGVTGCATPANMVQTKDQGRSQVYPVNSTQAWKIAKTVFHWEAFEVIEEQRGKGYLVGRSGNEYAPWAALTIAWVDRVDPKHTKVTVLTKRRVGGKSETSETTFHERFAQALQMVKRGKLLPPVPPT